MSSNQGSAKGKASQVDSGARRTRSGKLLEPYLQKKPRVGIKKDRIHPGDLAKFNLAFFCDQCSHYDSPNRYCTMGYRPQHTREEQMALYNLTGTMALCRFLEID